MVYMIRPMDLRTFYLGLAIDGREAMAAACGTTLGHLRNVAYGKLCGEALAMNIERYTNGVVTCEELRPDLTDQWSYMRRTVAVNPENQPKTEPPREAA